MADCGDCIMEMERDIDKIAKGWSIAMKYSQERLEKVYNLDREQLDAAIHQGHLVLETVCLFVHACIKHGQYRRVVPITEIPFYSTVQ